MKKLIALVIAMMLLCATGCSLSGKTDSDGTSQSSGKTSSESSKEQSDETVKQESIDEVMNILEDQGFKKTDEGYVWENHEADVDSEYTLKAKGNKLYFEGHFDFGKDNSEMAKTFSADETSINNIPANYLVALADYAATTDASVDYVVYVGKTKAAKGSLTYRQAEKIVSDIDD